MGVHIPPPLTRTHLGFGVIRKQEWHGVQVVTTMDGRSSDDGSTVDGGNGRCRRQRQRWRRRMVEGRRKVEGVVGCLAM